MTRIRLTPKRQPRHGFTLIELLVVISIIAVLVSLIAPAVQAARRTAKKLECLNNMRNVGIAMQSFSATTGSLPYLTNDISISNGNGTGFIYGAGWPMQLLPALDASNVLKNVKAYASSPAVTGRFVVNTTEQIWIPAFTCPEDAHSFRRPGGLSYVINIGFIPQEIWDNGETSALLQPYVTDWNGNGVYSLNGIALSTGTVFDAQDQSVQTATGVFVRATTGVGSNSFQSSLEYVSAGDGQENTLLITENLTAGTWNGSFDTNTGANHLGFGIRLPVSTSTFQVTPGLFTPGTLATTSGAGGFADASVNPDVWVVNRNLNATVGTAPRPSSQHASGVNIIMSSGAGRYLSESVDKLVYAKLLTSNGVNFGEQTLDARGY